MSRIIDLLQTEAEIKQSARWKTDHGFREALNERLVAIGKATCEENGVAFGSLESLRLSPQTLLGTDSQKLYDDLEVWWSIKMAE